LTAAAHSIAVEQQTSIQALAGKTVERLTVLSPDKQPPSKCAVVVVSTSLTVLLDVSGQVTNLDEEVGKLKRKVGKLQETVSRQRDLLSKPGFEEKVSETVRLAEKKKLIDAESAIGNYERTIEQFQKLEV
jgi:valyl-tRNA synthetase